MRISFIVYVLIGVVLVGLWGGNVAASTMSFKDDNYLEEKRKREEASEKAKQLSVDTKIMDMQVMKKVMDSKREEDKKKYEEKKRIEEEKKRKAEQERKRKAEQERKRKAEQERKERLEEEKRDREKRVEKEEGAKKETRKQEREKAVEKKPEKKEVKKVSSGFNVEATAYVAMCDSGCTGVTATGVDVRNTTTYKGMGIIAVDPNVIPLYSKVRINGRAYIALDTGGAIKGNKIDILVGSTGEALNFGRRTVNVEIIG